MSSQPPLFQELLCAVHDTCDVQRCREILDSGLDVNTTNSAGCTALMFAAMPNDYGDHNCPDAMLRIVKTLLDHGADPAIVDSFGMTAWTYAQQLIDPNWKNRFGNSAASLWNDPSTKSTIARIVLRLKH